MNTQKYAVYMVGGYYKADARGQTCLCIYDATPLEYKEAEKVIARHKLTLCLDEKDIIAYPRAIR